MQQRRRRIRRELGRLDVLVNNAGIAVFGTASAASLDDIRAVFETNVFGVIAVTQALLPLLREAPAGRIVNVSSRIGSLSVITDPAFPMRGIGGVAYGPSKSALNAVTVAFAQELADTNDQGELGLPRVHRDRSERPQRTANGLRSGARAGAPCAARARRPQRNVLERRRLDPVVMGILVSCAYASSGLAFVATDLRAR